MPTGRAAPVPPWLPRFPTCHLGAPGLKPFKIISEYVISGLLLAALVWLYQFAYESRLRGALNTSVVRIALAAGMVLYLCLCSSGGGAFIYFQF